MDFCHGKRHEACGQPACRDLYCGWARGWVDVDMGGWVGKWVDGGGSANMGGLGGTKGGVGC